MSTYVSKSASCKMLELLFNYWQYISIFMYLYSLYHVLNLPVGQNWCCCRPTNRQRCSWNRNVFNSRSSDVSFGGIFLKRTSCSSFLFNLNVESGLGLCDLSALANGRTVWEHFSEKHLCTSSPCPADKRNYEDKWANLPCNATCAHVLFSICIQMR